MRSIYVVLAALLTFLALGGMLTPTWVLVVATLGTGEDEQFVDALEGTRKERFLLHYNFPPYSVGETGRMGSPGRREIGHGKLAWRAVHPLMP